MFTHSLSYVSNIFTLQQEAVQRMAITASFYYTKQPARIRQVLKQVYSVNPEYVDDDLVESIRQPALDSNAPEVFFRIITQNGSGPSLTFNKLLNDLQCPLLLAWGVKVCTVLCMKYMFVYACVCLLISLYDVQACLMM